MGAYADYGAELIERGYAAIPIKPDSKRPAIFNWSHAFDNGPPPETVRARWGAGNAGVGVLGGHGGLVPADIDTTDPKIWTALMAVLPPSSVRKSGQKGETLFYFGPGIASRTWKINDRVVIELMGPGRQTVLPPTVHPDTKKPYRWTGSKALNEVAPQDLPRLPADIENRITDVLTPFGYRPGPPTPERTGIGGGDDSPYRELNDLALANLSVWVPALGLYRCRPARGGYEAVPTWRASTTGREPEKRHRNLKISPIGIKDFGANQGYTPLDLVMMADGSDLDTAFRFLSERLNFRVDIDVSGLDPIDAPDTAHIGTCRHGDARRHVGDEQVRGGPEPKIPSEPFIDELETFAQRVPGAIGDIIDWIVATARRPNRVLALGTAVAVVGTLIGRRVVGPTRSATHLYVVPIAETAVGKQHVIDTSLRLMRAAKAECHIGPSRFHSGSAVFRRLETMPLMLCSQDEIGAVIRAVTNPNASSHERAIGEVLRSLWGISFGTLVAPAWATVEDMRPINCPAVSILGVSTSYEFYAALQGESVANGLLNRFLVLATRRRAPDGDPMLDPFVVPLVLREALHQLYLWKGPGSLLHINDPTVTFTPDLLPWANQPAQARYVDFTREVEAYMEQHPEAAAHVARCSETAIRLATIRAAGRWGRGATVDLTDMQWGADLAWRAGLSLLESIQDHVPQNERSEMTDKILGTIRAVA
jgi:hypothetical protein